MPLTRSYILVALSFYLFGCAETVFEPWTPSWNRERRDLLCDDVCRDRGTTVFADSATRYERCCTCRSTTDWSLDSSKTPEPLYVEYITIFGRSLLLVDEPVPRNDSIFQVTHREGVMASLPENLCDFAGIVKLDLSDNSILDIGNLSCLTFLDTLNLSRNDISYVSNTSFQSLWNLRILDLSRNNIGNLDPGILFNPILSLFDVDVSNNNLEALDVTNIISNKSYCDVDYSFNQIEKLTNTRGITLDLSNSYGKGFIDLKFNNFQTFPDFKRLLNLDSLADMGKFLDSGFALETSKLFCDCHMEAVARLYQDTTGDSTNTFLWTDYYNTTCHGPARMEGRRVVDVFEDLDYLTCEIEELCPIKCQCIDQPSQNVIKVNCSNRGLTEMPTVLPDSLFSLGIELDVSDNHITVIRNAPFLGRVTVINAANNDIKVIEETAAAQLKNISKFNLDNNANLLYLPQNFGFLNSCVLELPNNVFECNCDTQWTGIWLDVKGCESQSILCRLPSGEQVRADSNWYEELNCKESSPTLVIIVSLSIVIVVLVLVANIVFIFRYELIVLHLKLRGQPSNAISPVFKFDVFLSFDDSNDHLTRWVARTLMPQLEEDGYNVLLPCRDTIGDVRDTATIELLRQTRSFLTILSESYLAQDGHAWTDNEWKYGWNMYKEDCHRKLVMVNYDLVSSWDVRQPQIRAFLRVGGPVDFTNRKLSVLEEIERRLGLPVKKEFEVGDQRRDEHQERIQRIYRVETEV